MIVEVKARNVFHFTTSNRENPLLFFIHIPKTAGTSFRKSAEQLFTKAYTLYDYSPKSSETSSLILETVYKESDLFSLQQQLNDFDIQFLSGHVPATKYIHVFGVQNAVTFLRDPVQRIFSEYHHFVRNNDYKDDFKSFYTKPQFINRQSKMLQGVPLKALGFVGLTEDYAASLLGINRQFKLELANLELNMGRNNKQTPYELDKETLAEVQSLNQADIALYQKACALFTERQALEQQGLPFVHGDIQQHTVKSVTGWAFNSQHDQPVVIHILHNGKQVGASKASDLRPGMLRLGLPRHGYVGFHFNFEHPCQSGDTISCQVAETGQLLSTITIN